MRLITFGMHDSAAFDSSNSISVKQSHIHRTKTRGEKKHYFVTHSLILGCFLIQFDNLTSFSIWFHSQFHQFVTLQIDFFLAIWLPQFIYLGRERFTDSCKGLQRKPTTEYFMANSFAFGVRALNYTLFQCAANVRILRRRFSPLFDSPPGLQMGHQHSFIRKGNISKCSMF